MGRVLRRQGVLLLLLDDLELLREGVEARVAREPVRLLAAARLAAPVGAAPSATAVTRREGRNGIHGTLESLRAEFRHTSP